MNPELQAQGFWEEAWTRHVEGYLKAPPRAGMWLRWRFALRPWRVLEIAGGSCRDSRHLAEHGVAAVGTDFDAKTLAYLAHRFPSSPLPLQREDASALSFADRSFDLSFHNGFWVLFDDDARILALLREQARVTRRAVVALVHNAENGELRTRFARQAASDALYDIRFFSRDDLARLVRAAGVEAQAVRFEKFGGPVDSLLALPGALAAPASWLVPRLYRFVPWSRVERIALVIEQRDAGPHAAGESPRDSGSSDEPRRP